jgi:aspartate-semialdehyde dehydrogenase
MEIAVIGARGAAGRVCVKEIENMGHVAIPLSGKSEIPANSDGIILASAINNLDFTLPVVDCSGALLNTTLVLPNVLEKEASRKRIPNCMASLIAQALSSLHNECTLKTITATCMQSVSGAGWRGVQALEQQNTEELFGGQLENNILPHEKAEQEESAIRNDLQELFGCKVTATSFRVPVFVGHVASLQIKTESPISASLLPESPSFDPRTMENKRDVAIGRVRIHKNTADLVVCGDQLLCGTAIPAITSIVGT